MLQIVIIVELQVLIEMLLVVLVSSLDFPIVALMGLVAVLKPRFPLSKGQKRRRFLSQGIRMISALFSAYKIEMRSAKIIVESTRYKSMQRL